MKIGCSTPVKSRQLFLRTCILQMQAQTLRPDKHVIMFNGEQATSYDTRVIQDLADDSLILKAYPYNSSIAELSVHCLKILLEHDIDLFFKIDSDDMYTNNYIQTIAAEFAQRSEDLNDKPLVLNLINQLWLTVQPDNDVGIRESSFAQGLGLSSAEIEQGIQVGAPPTYVMNRSAVELIVNDAERPEFQRIPSDDILFRRILIKHGVVIQRVSTESPVFGYVQHAKNSSDW